MTRTADLTRISTADAIDDSGQATKESDQGSVDDTATWIFGKKRRLIPAAVVFNEWRRRTTPSRHRQPSD